MANNSGDSTGSFTLGIICGAVVVFFTMVIGLKASGACLGRLCLVQLPF